MKPEEMREDISEDVREELAETLRLLECNAYPKQRSILQTNIAHTLREAIRAKPKTVILPRAEIPAPLTKIPESGKVWTIWGGDGVVLESGQWARHAVKWGLAWATEKEAIAAFLAFTAQGEGESWIPHTPGDPRPCDMDLKIEVRLDSGKIVGVYPAIHWNWTQQKKDYNIIAWRRA